MKYQVKSCMFMSLHQPAAIKPGVSVCLIETLIASSMRHWSAKHISVVRSNMSTPRREGVCLCVCVRRFLGCMCVLLAQDEIVQVMVLMWEWQRSSHRELYGDVWDRHAFCNMSHILVCVRVCANVGVHAWVSAHGFPQVELCLAVSVICKVTTLIWKAFWNVV